MTPTDVTLSLISHTNVGKTTLARTLLRQDVGEVLDQAHVTEVAERFLLIDADTHRLLLWDTPGLGNSARLMKLLRRQREPLGWLWHQVWDRVVDRPLFCSQRAVDNVRREADVVLYLVNASEDPEGAGYVGLELELLSWTERPVLVLLNQTGANQRGVEARWRGLADQWPVVRGVMSLDAYVRCWVEEDALLRRVAELLEGDKRRVMETLAGAWAARNLGVFQGSIGRLADYVAEAAEDRETAGVARGDDESLVQRSWREVLRLTPVDRRRAMQALNRRLDRATARLMDELIAAHGLEGASAARIEQRVQDFQIRGSTIPLDERTGALAGAVVSGAISGLAADILSGGMTLGGGMIAGGILGALGGAAIGRGYRLVGGDERPTVSWSTDFLNRLVEQSILRYLAVAHFGRGRGEYRDVEHPAHWGAAVERALDRRLASFERLWSRAQGEPGSDGSPLREDLRRSLEQTLAEVLRETYPNASRLLG